MAFDLCMNLIYVKNENIHFTETAAVHTFNKLSQNVGHSAGSH